MVYSWDEEAIIREYLKNPGYGARYRIEKQGKYSWKTIDKVIFRYLQDHEEADKETQPKHKSRLSGLPAVYFLLLLGVLIGGYYLLPRFISWVKERQPGLPERKEKEPETKKLADLSEELRSQQRPGGGFEDRNINDL